MAIHVELNASVNDALRIWQARLESWAAFGSVPGVSVGIVHDQRVIYTRSIGFSDRERQQPATMKTIYRVGSISKLFTTTAIMMLRDKGFVSLHEPVKTYLPWFDIRHRGKNARHITIEHLLTHTSGLPREAPFAYWNDNRFPSREEMIRALKTQETAYVPGTQWKYSNLGLAIAGEVVAAVSGMPYETFIERRIFKPLGMSDSSVFPNSRQRAQMATGYGRRWAEGAREIMPFTDSGGITPAANISSTVGDLARFVSLQFHEGKAGKDHILSMETLQEMRHVHWLLDDWKSAWGLGFGISRLGDRVIVGHGGSVMGHRAELRFCPRCRVGVIILTNADLCNPSPLARLVFEHIAPVIEKACRPAKSEKTEISDPERYLGRFSNTWGDTEVILNEGGLALIDPGEDDPWGNIIRLAPKGKNSFVLDRGEGHESIGETVLFDFCPDGRPRRIRVGNTWHYAVNSWHDRPKMPDLHNPS
ncbi:MAG TPA: serine hydrolase domain-containing protein [Candidatus Sumerlaeota bacterium]|nr:serine hydrolase domain-containing protein [Candidatus Sumerlaeota bacterium]